MTFGNVEQNFSEELVREDVLGELEKDVRKIKCQEEDLWLIELVLKKIDKIRKRK